MQNNIHNKNGDISVYGLACGYIQRTENDDNGQSVELFGDSCRTYQVRLIDYKAPEFGSDFNKGLGCGRFLLAFESLTKARKVYNKLKTRVEREWDYLDVISFDNGEV